MHSVLCFRVRFHLSGLSENFFLEVLALPVTGLQWQPVIVVNLVQLFLFFDRINLFHSNCLSLLNHCSRCFGFRPCLSSTTSDLTLRLCTGVFNCNFSQVPSTSSDAQTGKSSLLDLISCSPSSHSDRLAPREQVWPVLCKSCSFSQEFICSVFFTRYKFKTLSSFFSYNEYNIWDAGLTQSSVLCR